ncbi:MAG: hypothetical protein ACLQGP_13860 [Isosphaeraceae bacterium]
MAIRLPQMRLTVRSSLIGVALVGLNLAAALATANAGGDWPRRSMVVGGRTPGDVYRAVDGRDEYGVGCLYAGYFHTTDGRGSVRLSEVWRAPLPATRLQVWSPVIASVSITVLVLALSCWSWNGPPRCAHSDAGGRQRPGSSTLRTAARWGLLITSLIALNLAGAVHRPGFNLYDHDAAHPPSPAHHAELARSRSSPWREAYRPCHQYALKFVGDFDPARSGRAIGFGDDATTDCQRIEYRDLFVGTPKVLNIEVDGLLVERCPMETGGRNPDHEDEARLPDAIFQDSPNGEASIDFQSDGGIRAYAGRAGKMLTRPRPIRSPTFSSLEMHGPLVASVAITGLVLVIVFRRLGPRERRVLCIVMALAGLNAAAAFVSHQIGEPPRLLSRLETWGQRGGSHVERREEYFSDGSRLVSTNENEAPSWRLAHIERPSPPPTFLKIGWPAIAGALISTLILGIWSHRASRPTKAKLPSSSTDPDADA